MLALRLLSSERFEWNIGVRAKDRKAYDMSHAHVFKKGYPDLRVELKRGGWEWVFLRRERLGWLVNIIRLTGRDAVNQQRLYDWQRNRDVKI
jgi:hypothetical protein